MLSYVITSKNIFINCDGESKIINNTDEKYNAVYELIQKQANDEEFKKLLFSKDDIKNYCKESFENSDIEIGEDTILIDNEPVYGGLCTYIRELYNKKLPLNSVVNFVKKLRKNPSYRIRHQLWGFIEAAQADGGFTLDNDGNIIAYKVVTNDFKDKYTRTFDNSIGSVVTMDRTNVDDDPEKTCSSGLHFCAYSYVKNYCSGDDKLVLVKVSPEDVVSIPVDYGNAKGRCCKYEVLEEVENPINKPIYDKGADEENVTDMYDNFNKKHCVDFVTEWLDTASLKDIIGLYEYIIDDNKTVNYATRDEYTNAILKNSNDFEILAQFIKSFENNIDKEEIPSDREKFIQSCKNYCENWLNTVSILTLLKFVEEFISCQEETDFMERDEVMNEIRKKYEENYCHMIDNIASFEGTSISELISQFSEHKCEPKSSFCTKNDEVKAEHYCIKWLNSVDLYCLVNFASYYMKDNFKNDNHFEREDIVQEIRAFYDTYYKMLKDICDFDPNSNILDILKNEK